MSEEMTGKTSAPDVQAASPNGTPSPSEAPPSPEAATTTAAEADPLEELRQKAAKADEHWDRLLRLAADFDNFKKRAVRERQEAIKFANTALLEKLLPVLDNFEMALAALNQPQNGNVQSLQTGVAMIHQQLRSVLLEAGLEEVDALGKPFDPNLHEAVAQEASAEVPEGHVLKQLRKGYRLKERLLRPASVVVATRPPSAEQPS